MAAPMLDNELWELIQPLLPRRTRRYRHLGRLQDDDLEYLVTKSTDEERCTSTRSR